MPKTASATSIIKPANTKAASNKLASNKLASNKLAATNVVALVGRLARPAELRELPSGDRLAAYEVTVSREGERAEGVPVVWFNAPPAALDLDVNDEVVVVGRVRRRFYRAGGATQSRTEVVAETIVPSRLTKRVIAALATVLTRLEEVTT